MHRTLPAAVPSAYPMLQFNGGLGRTRACYPQKFNERSRTSNNTRGVGHREPSEHARPCFRARKRKFALGFLTGMEMTWLPEAMHILRRELPTVDVTVSSDYSPDLAEGLERGSLDLAFLRADPDFDLTYQVVSGTTRRLNAQRPSPDDI